MNTFENKLVLVIGGTTGIGYASAEQFRDAGAKVIITGQNQARIDEAVQKLGDNAVGIRADVAHLSEIEALFSEIKQRFDRLDVLFFNAGIVEFAPLTQATEDHFDRQMNINLKGAYFAIQQAASLLPKGGTIVVNTSIMNKIGMPGGSVYSASKAALRSLVRSLGAELVEQGIRINAVSPGPIETPIYGKLGMPTEQLEQTAKQLIQNVPLARFGQAAEVAKAVVFLASTDSSYILGEEIAVDGGWTAI